MGLDEVRADWTRLGAAEPLWAVCVDPAKRGGGWDDDEFLASGRREIDAALGRLADLGLRPGTGRALDFGCGAGRLSNALAAHFDAVVGVDISPPMLAEARRLDRSGGRIEFRLNDRPDLAGLPDASFDLVYTDLVLQHLPPPLAEGYLREFTRVVRPGGAMVIGVPDRERPTFKGLVFRHAPWPLIRLAQRVLLGYPAPMRMHPVPAARLAAVLAEGGARVAASEEYWGGDHWHHLRHYVAVPEEAR
ncbi:class I SAM-dependent methyltransferase [Streptomonospora nanhaiensis]|uniref:SAM-dependent methyltransferase n=1 Tax=Streptomonospora nanhaiensis TaxID=1323731 RepID=A0A853BKK1_9ACTN|nr:class I SAM-dependent methyltransferase [Streptomonospora nanhaiensis]MBX9390855.1 class I SAM-dependent methyltransferase [Streptomonospora nanhaiensis]NYI96028.1 SAM-dependent methyltransferase [Streptomonospora nanhaiensis]